MFKMTALLLATLGLTMIIGGRDFTEEERLAYSGAPEPVEAPTAKAVQLATAPKPTPPKKSAPAQVILASAPAAPAVPAMPQKPAAKVNRAVAEAAALAAAPAPATPLDAAPTPDEEIIIRYVTAKRLNVRSGPSTNFDVLGQVLRGEAVQIISDPDQDWVEFQIEGDGMRGFTAARFLSEDNPFGG